MRSLTVLLTLSASLTACEALEGLFPGEETTTDTPTITTDTGAPVDEAILDAQAIGDDRIVAAVTAGQIVLDLGEGRDDPTVVDDAKSLLVGAIDGIALLDFDAGHSIELVYLGVGALGEIDPQDPEEAQIYGRTVEELSPALGLVAFNAGNRNEFRLSFNDALLEAVHRYDSENRLELGTPGGYERDEIPPGAGAYAWSNGADDRFRWYGVNEEVTVAAHRRIVQMGGGCTGTLVGPRHVVTAGHCIYSRRNGTWADNFWVRAGANGTNEQAEVFVDADNIPGGQVLWYYTPSQFRATSGSTWGYDYGILTLPGRLGDVVGWMGRVTYTADDLQDAYVYRRGYPLCNATLQDGTPRIDEPSPCNANHLYANSNDCSVGEFQSQDANSWSRVVHHSCDASAADSGSPLYVYHNGTPAVAAVHFASLCEVTADDDDCTGSFEDRPLAALRLTPQYRDLIGTFRSIFP